ncbi:MAG: D-alanyl-D-alanine carboxypeptidase [Opitutus sp.]|nr:D-alanyl-D-alanine carboxypeptidase [Opitutus sp.]
MTFLRPTFLLMALALGFNAFAANVRKAPTRPGAADNAGAFKGAIVMDAATGNVILEDRADVVTPPASMTKLMTFAVIYDALQKRTLTLESPVTVTAADSKIGGTKVWLKQGEIFPVEELLYAMMIQSANDAAYALARTTAGSVEAFVERMNAKAQEFGMSHTTFRTPHGLPPANRRIDEGDVSSPRDFALLSRHLVSSTDVLKYTSVKERPFGPPVRAQAVAMRNHDNLIGKVAGVDGLKTGFTSGAGFCLAATAQRNGLRVIVVVMGSPDSKSRDLKVSEFIERGFATMPVTPAATAATPSTSSSPISPAPAAAARPASAPPPPPANGSPAIKLLIPKK